MKKWLLVCLCSVLLAVLSACSTDSSVPSTPGLDLAPQLVIDPGTEDTRVAFVIDDTGSMRDEIAAVRSSLVDTLIPQMLERDAKVRWDLFSFKDTVKNSGAVYDSDAAVTWANGLRALNGGDCPEASFAAIGAAADSLIAGSQGDVRKVIFMATDAAPRMNAADRKKLEKKLVDNDIELNIILTGGCEREVSLPIYEEFTDNIGAGFFTLPNGATAAQVEALYKDVFEFYVGPATLLGVDVKYEVLREFVDGGGTTRTFGRFVVTNSNAEASDPIALYFRFAGTVNSAAGMTIKRLTYTPPGSTTPVPSEQLEGLPRGAFGVVPANGTRNFLVVTTADSPDVKILNAAVGPNFE